MKKRKIIAHLDTMYRNAETLAALNRQAEADFSKRQTAELNATRAAAHEYWASRFAELLAEV